MMADQNPQDGPSQDSGTQAPVPSNDTEESGAGYGNHGDVDQGGGTEPDVSDEETD
jgi:hypothetical protein